MDFLEYFNRFKEEIRDKWLDYYEVNSEWIDELMNGSNQADKLESGSRPDAMFIIGVVSALMENSTEFFAFATHLNSDCNKLISALGLDFDPKSELKRREARWNQV